MYESVSSVVKHGLDVSSVIQQHVGLRQGCILSPCLFSLFIADFPKHLESYVEHAGSHSAKCVGVSLRTVYDRDRQPIHETRVRVLLYADDGVLVASSVEDLQRMLNALKTYCAKWRMFVNTAKTKVIVFNHTTRKSVWETSMPSLFYNGVKLEVVEEFKYLGIMFHANTRYKAAVEHRLLQGKRLVAAWMRRCNIWCFKPDVVVSQFKTFVLPALEYGVGLWGAGTYKSHTWEQVEVFWRYIARCILGVSTRAPNSGVYGDLGWFPFYTRASWQAIAFFTRATEMPSNSLVREAMYAQRTLLAQGKDCWLSTLKDTLCTTSYGSICWNTWWLDSDFMCACSRISIDDRGKQCVIRWEDDCYDECKNLYIHDHWHKDVIREHAKHGEGGNKLRTYKLFKQSWGFEPYLVHIDNRDKRVLMSKFRIGICPLRIETGRYENDGHRKCISPHERICLVCRHPREIEDEFHFLLQCPTYSRLRCRLLQVVKDILNLSDADIARLLPDSDQLFASVMGSQQKEVICAVSDYLWDAFRMREQVMLDREAN